MAGIGPKGREYIVMDLGLLVGLGKRMGAQACDDVRLISSKRRGFYTLEAAVGE